MNEIFESGEKIIVPRRHAIVPDKNVFFIQKGYVGLYAGKGKSKRLLVIMWPGTTFPLEIEPTPSSHLWLNDIHYRTLSSTTLRVLPKSTYSMHKPAHEDLEKQVARSERAKSLMIERMINFGLGDVPKRLFMRLLFIASYMSTKRGDSATAKVQLTYADLAESIGTTRETVNRLMSQLQSDGVVSVEKHIVTIHSLKKLEALYKERN